MNYMVTIRLILQIAVWTLIYLIYIHYTPLSQNQNREKLTTAEGTILKTFYDLLY
jgi:hypothetical protein